MSDYWGMPLLQLPFARSDSRRASAPSLDYWGMPWTYVDPYRERQCNPFRDILEERQRIGRDNCYTITNIADWLTADWVIDRRFRRPLEDAAVARMERRETALDTFWLKSAARRTRGVNFYEFYKYYIDVLIRTARRSTRRIEDALRRWAEGARARVAFRPGGAGYLQARSDFMEKSGQSRATRRYSPY